MKKETRRKFSDTIFQAARILWIVYIIGSVLLSAWFLFTGNGLGEGIICIIICRIMYGPVTSIPYRIHHFVMNLESNKDKKSASYSSSRSSSGTWYSGESFSASDYVRTHCRGQNYGVLLQDELEKIENDSSLTTVQKEKAKEEYKWRVGANNLSGSETPWR